MSTFRQVPMAHRSQAGSTPSSPKVSPFTPATLTPTLPLQIAERIGEAVVDEQFAPGERLKEVDLATAFGVSRATVREALRILENRGLVRILPEREPTERRITRRCRRASAHSPRRGTMRRRMRV